MEILTNIFKNQIINTLFFISITSVMGLYIGNIKISGIAIGITGVLFSGILISYLNIPLNDEVIHFTREFGLILFIYAVGIGVGKSFFSSFKKNGLKYNAFTIIIVLLNVILTFTIFKIFNIEKTLMIGMYCGSVTNTPALGSAQNLAINYIDSSKLAEISTGYALTYPGTIVALVLTMIILKIIFKKDIENEITTSYSKLSSSDIKNLNINVENKNLDNTMIKDIPAIDKLNIIVTRIKKNGKIYLANPNTVLNIGDIILAVGKEKNLIEFSKIVGSISKEDLKKETSSNITHTRVVVSKKDVIGKKISETQIPSYDVIVTRALRSDVEFIVNDEYTFQLGDNVVIVGEKDNLEKVIKILGNSPKDLNHTDLIPIFIGIIVGIIIGNIPFKLPFFSDQITLGVAGGLLVSAIIFSNIENIGRISWYIPPASSILLREFGIVLFLTAVGLKTGKNFFNTIIYGSGIKIMILGFLISFLPIFILGIIAKKFYGINYFTLTGILSGSMTDPPALAFANSMTDSNLPSMAYATVYPLTMFLRIITAQIFVIYFYAH